MYINLIQFALIVHTLGLVPFGDSALVGPIGLAVACIESRLLCDSFDGLVDIRLPT